MSAFNADQAEKSSERGWRQSDRRTVGMQRLSTRLDSDNEDYMSKYRSSIVSILGDSVATSIYASNSVATASIFGDLRVATPYTYASRKSARGDTTSAKESLDPPSSPSPAHRNRRRNDGHHHDHIFALSGSYISRTGRKRGDSSTAKKKLDPPTVSLPIRKNGVDNGLDRTSTRDGSAHASRNGKRKDSAANNKKLDLPSFTLPVHKRNAEGSVRDSTSTGYGSASATPARKSHDGSGHARTSSHGSASATSVRKNHDGSDHAHTRSHGSASATLVRKSHDGNGHARTRSHGSASATPVRKSHDVSGHARTRSHGSAPAAKMTCASSPDGAPGVCYRVGETRHRRAHSTPFDSPSQAAALLARLPLRSPLFVKRSDRQFTCAVLMERRPAEDDGGASLVIALDGDGKRTKVLERRHWERCLRLVNTCAVDYESS